MINYIILQSYQGCEMCLRYMFQVWSESDKRTLGQSGDYLRTESLMSYLVLSYPPQVPQGVDLLLREASRQTKLLQHGNSGFLQLLSLISSTGQLLLFSVKVVKYS